MANRELNPWQGGGRSLSPYGEDPFSSFRRQFDRLFDDFFHPAETRSFAAREVSARPSIDVRETDQAYEVSAELPGLDRQDVQLELKDNMLRLSGEKRAEHKGEENGLHWSERSFGRFERTVPFDAEIDAAKTTAGFKNGVLTVTLPKNPRAKDTTRKIEIRPQ